MTLTGFDLLLSALIILLMLKVTLSGFIAEFFSKAAVIAGTITAIMFYRLLSPLIVSLLGPAIFPDIVAFLLIFLAVYLVIKYIQNLAGAAFESETMTNLDRAMGFFLGIAEGLLLVIVILIFLKNQRWFDASRIMHNSVYAELLNPFLPEGIGFLGNFLGE